MKNKLLICIVITLTVLLSINTFANFNSLCVFSQKYGGIDFIINYFKTNKAKYKHIISYYYNNELIARIHYNDKTRFYIYDYRQDGTVNNQLSTYESVIHKEYTHVLISNNNFHYYFTYQTPDAFYSNFINKDSCTIIHPINTYVIERKAKFYVYQFPKKAIDQNLYYLETYQEKGEILKYVWAVETNSFLSIAISKIIDREAIKLRYFSNIKLKGRERVEYLINQIINTVEKQINNYAKRIDKIIIVQKPLIFK